MGFILSKDALFTKVKNVVASGTATTWSDVIDTAGYDAVMGLTSLGTANAANLMKMQCCDTTSGTFEDIASGEVDSTGGSDEDQFVDVIYPPKRYVRLSVRRGGAATTIENIWAVRYRPRTVAQDNQTPGTIEGKTLVAPATGTA